MSLETKVRRLELDWLAEAFKCREKTGVDVFQVYLVSHAPFGLNLQSYV